MSNAQTTTDLPRDAALSRDALSRDALYRDTPASGASAPRGASVTEDLRVSPLLPGWVLLLIAAGFALGAWLTEGRRKRA